MIKIEWNENMLINVDSIDIQHKRLIDLTNTFYERVNEGYSREKMLELIQDLKDYMVYHFSTEELYLKQVKYAGFKRHKMEHDKFVETVLSFEERYKSGKLLLTVEIMNFIKDWVTNHIMGSDKKFSELLQRNGIN
jgi:hemerythrin